MTNRKGHVNPTDAFIETIVDFANEAIPSEVIAEAKNCILDYLGTAIGGARMMKPKHLAYLDALGATPDSVALIGLHQKTSIQNAVLLNAMSSHVLEMDDGNRFCGVHLGATILPALFAVCEYEKLSGTELLRGTVVGYEAAVRLGRAMQPSHTKRGFHVSSTCGPVGAALGIAAAWGFSRERMKDALSAAATSAGGLLGAVADASELKPFNIGRAALDGLTAAYLARAGFSGPDDILGGERGLLAAMSDGYDTSGFSKQNDDGFNIVNTYRKPYAACRHCHPAIEAAIRIAETHGVSGAEVDQIEVHTYQQATLGHDHTDILGVNSAKMSMPFGVAVALETGKAGLTEFAPESITNESILALTRRVKVCVDEELSALAPGKRAAILEVTTRNAERFRERVDYPKGEPENSLTPREIEEKFIALAKFGGKSEKEASELIMSVRGIDDQPITWFGLLT